MKRIYVISKTQADICRKIGVSAESYTRTLIEERHKKFSIRVKDFISALLRRKIRL